MKRRMSRIACPECGKKMGASGIGTHLKMHKRQAREQGRNAAPDFRGEIRKIVQEEVRTILKEMLS
jgi:hypothetical protein